MITEFNCRLCSGELIKFVPASPIKDVNYLHCQHCVNNFTTAGYFKSLYSIFDYKEHNNSLCEVICLNDLYTIDYTHDYVSNTIRTRIFTFDKVKFEMMLSQPTLIKFNFDNLKSCISKIEMLLLFR